MDLYLEFYFLKPYFEFFNINYRKVTARYPQANEKFVKVVSKAIKTSVYENKN